MFLRRRRTLNGRMCLLKARMSLLDAGMWKEEEREEGRDEEEDEERKAIGRGRAKRERKGRRLSPIFYSRTFCFPSSAGLGVEGSEGKKDEEDH